MIIKYLIGVILLCEYVFRGTKSFPSAVILDKHDPSSINDTPDNIAAKVCGVTQGIYEKHVK